MTRTFGIALVLSALVGAPTPADAAPLYLRTAFTQDASSGMHIAWTSFSDPEVGLEYGDKPGVYTKTVTGTMDTIDATLGTTSEVTLNGLKPNTTYYYRVGGTKGGWSAEHSFTTGPPQHQQCGALRFVYAGDSRSEEIFSGQGPSPLWMQLLAQSITYKPDFLLHGGDIIYTGTDRKLWADWLQKTAPYSAKLPMMMGIGNHDDGPGEGDGANYNRIFNLPRSDKTLGGSGTEDFYYFTYGNAIFVAISTATFSGGSPKWQQQAAWLDKVLTQNPKRWRFVYLHHPIYTENLFVNHPPNEVSQNAAFVPIFNKHHVDVVFQSHNHYYERWVPSKCAKADSKIICPSGGPETGTTYITSGGAGALAFPWAGFTNPYRPAANGGHHVMRLDIDDHQLKLVTFAVPGGNQLDSLTITKKIVGPDPCAAPAADAGVPDVGAAKDSATPADQGTSADSAMPADTGAPSADTGAAADGKPVADSKLAADSKPAVDSKPAADGSTSTDASSGCGCRVDSASASGSWWALLLLLALALRRRRA
jgi:MYXO-CTERM domain-containing protein